MIDTEELDRIWRDGLARLATPAEPLPAPAPLVAARARRRRTRSLALVALAASIVVALVAVVVADAAAGHRTAVRPSGPVSQPTPTVVPTVVHVLDSGPSLAVTFDAADPSVAGDASHVTLPGGWVRFVVTVLAPGHRLELDGVPAFTPVTELGTSARVVELAPGRYRLYCAIPGHAEAGEAVSVDVR